MARRTAKKTGPPKFVGDECIVVLHGPESFLRSEYLTQLREAIAKHTQDELETIRFDGSSAELADVLDELRSFGLMQQHKVVVVDEADDFVKTHREALTRYAESPVDMATLVLRAGKWNKGNLDKAIAKVGQLVECRTPNPADVLKWATHRSKSKYGVSIEARAASLLIDHLGAELGRVDNELGKLAAGTREGASITADQVEAMVGRASDEHAWEIQSALLSGNAHKAIDKLHELIDVAGQPKELISYAVADLMRKLHHAAAMLRAGRDSKSICSELKIFPWDRQPIFMKAAQRIRAAEAARLLRLILELDRRSKSGFGEAVPNIERFCVQFADTLR